MMICANWLSRAPLPGRDAEGDAIGVRRDLSSNLMLRPLARSGWTSHRWPPRGEASPATWKAFIAALEQGKTRAIGVSNYSIAQVDELTAATGRAPALNQIPWNPFVFSEREVAELRSRHVVLEGYSPLKRSDLGNPVLAEIAAAHGKTAAQVILRWHVEHGFVVIPRSRRRERIEENFAIFDFELTTEELGRLDRLGD
jgi:2,5-diketo-D-gluconate reductase A